MPPKLLEFLNQVKALAARLRETAVPRLKSTFAAVRTNAVPWLKATPERLKNLGPTLKEWSVDVRRDVTAARHEGLKVGGPKLLRWRWKELVGLAVVLLFVIVLWPSKKPAPVPETSLPAAEAVPAAPVAPAAPKAPPRPVHAVARPSDADSVALRALAKQLHADGAKLENPCVVTAGAACMRSAMEPFFEALDRAPSLGKPTVILALGNSLIAGDGVVDVFRARLTAAYGDAGRGYLLADRMASYGSRSRCSARASGWKASTFAPPYKYRWPFGLAGVHHTAEKAGASSEFELSGETQADLFWLDRPEAAPIDVKVDGKLVTTLQPNREEKGRHDVVTLPPKAKELSLTARGKGAVMQGVVLEREQSGIVLDMLGVPSADASIFLQADEAIFEEQLKARHPSLVMLMFGGNETKRIAWGRSSQEKVIHDLRTLIGRVKKASDAACWVVGPLDAVVKRPGTGPFTQRPELEEVIRMERQVAVEEGCGWLDLFQAMGGSGSIKRFDAVGLMHPDRVHPKGRGLDVLGQLITDALFDAYAEARAPVQSPEAAR